MSMVSCDNFTNNTNKTDSVGYWNLSYPSQQYWNEVILQKSEGIHEVGGLVWQLVVVLFVS